jgi:hypothetical protein
MPSTTLPFMLVHIKTYFNYLATDTCFAFYFSFFIPAHCLHAYTLIGNIQQKFLYCCMSRQKALAFFCSTAGLVVEEPKSQEYNQTHKVCSAGAKGYMV